MTVRAMKPSMICICCVAVVNALLAPTASARSSSVNDAIGTIVYDRWLGLWGYAGGDLYAMAGDGSDERQLTSDGLASETDPAWAPGRARLAYASDSGSAPHWNQTSWKPGLHVYVSDADGSNARRITRGDDGLSWRSPSWAPSGDRLALASYEPPYYTGNIHTVNADGTGLRRVTRDPNGINHSSPRWSPDGKWIAFLRQDWAASGYTHLWLVSPDGSRLKQLTHGSTNAFSPAWSPDSRSLAYLEWDYDANGTTVSGNIHVIDIRSGKVRQVTNGSGLNEVPCWSPDGTKIAFTHVPAPVGVWTWVPTSVPLMNGWVGAHHEAAADMYVINVDGTELQQLTNTPEVGEFCGDWK